MYIRGCGIVITVGVPLRPANQLVHHIADEEASTELCILEAVV